ncbi:MAG TPA: VTT domain-containing protein [Streptosporangiaceae bacterium]|nr:VTT domain-containing protein [Streptosporangiaceae bacterium]
MSTPALPGIFGTLAPILNHYGYFAVGGLVLVEDFGIPVPGETILIAASLYAGAGKLNVVAVGLIAWVCAVLGDNIGFLIGHFGGRRLALKYGKYVFLTSARLDSAEHFFEHHGGKIIVAARFIEGLRQANGIVAGITGMHWKRFIPFNALGAALWVGLWVSVGYLAGNHITTIYQQITRYSLYVLIVLAVAVAALIGWRVRNHLQRRRARAEAQTDAAPADAAQTDAAPADAAQTDAAPADAAQTDAAPAEVAHAEAKPEAHAEAQPAPDPAATSKPDKP